MQRVRNQDIIYFYTCLLILLTTYRLYSKLQYSEIQVGISMSSPIRRSCMMMIYIQLKEVVQIWRFYQVLEHRRLHKLQIWFPIIKKTSNWNSLEYVRCCCLSILSDLLLTEALFRFDGKCRHFNTTILPTNLKASCK